MFFGIAFRCQSALTAVGASEWKPEPHANVIGVKARSCQSSGNVRFTLNNHTRYVWPIDSDRKHRPSQILTPSPSHHTKPDFLNYPCRNSSQHHPTSPYRLSLSFLVTPLFSA